ncbi:MAG TPA: TonB family protein [Opitutaceae bacterium]|nr:TonB family protein [Opitutaceae bacterium]
MKLSLSIVLLVSWCCVLSRAQPAGSGAGALPESDPMVKSWTAPVFPPTVPKTVRNGSARIRIIVDATGTVTAARVVKASAPAFGEAALAAVRRWRFSPGVVDGKYAATCLDVPVRFSRGGKPHGGLLPPADMMPQRARRTYATLDDAPLGDYPAALVGRGLPGTVVFRCDVDADGKASNLRIVQASHVDFVLPSFESFPTWKFHPAMEGDLKVPTEMEGEVTYSDTNIPPRDQVLAANGITAPDGSNPDAAPQPIAMADPVFPHDLLLKGEGGSASVDFTVQPNGAVTDVQVHAATNPEFGAALVAAVETWAFSPAMVRGQGATVQLRKHQEFKAVPLNATEDADGWTQLVVRARKKEILGGRGIDGRLIPLYRVAPVLPGDAQDGEKGSAVIDFVIDRDGRARLPWIVSASRPAYGWSAATAVSQWVFKAPTRDGKPTDVSVRIPIQF